MITSVDESLDDMYENGIFSASIALSRASWNNHIVETTKEDTLCTSRELFLSLQGRDSNRIVFFKAHKELRLLRDTLHGTTYNLDSAVKNALRQSYNSGSKESSRDSHNEKERESSSKENNKDLTGSYEFSFGKDKDTGVAEMGGRLNFEQDKNKIEFSGSVDTNGNWSAEIKVGREFTISD